MADPIRKLVTEIIFSLTGSERAEQVSEKIVLSLLQAVRQTDRLAIAQEQAQARIRAAEEATERARLQTQARIRAAEASESNSIRQRQTQQERSAQRQQEAAQRLAAAQARLDQARLIAERRLAQTQQATENRRAAAQQRAEAQQARFEAARELAERRLELQQERSSQAAERMAQQRRRDSERQEERETARQERIAARQERMAMQERREARLVEEQRIRAELRVQREIRATRREARALNREMLRGAGEFGHIASLLGLAYTGHQMIEMADQWAFITSSIRNVSDTDTQAQNTRERLFRTSQESGLGMEGVARLYNQLAMNREETHLSSDQIQDITRIVSRGLSLNHGTNSQNLRAIRQFDEMLSAGRLSLQHMNALRNDNPYLAGIMAQAAGGTNALNERIHSRQADMNYILDLISKMRDIIDRDFTHIQTTFGMAYQRIRNSLMRLMGEFIINNRVISTGLNALTNVVDRFVSGIEAAANYLGGFNQALRVTLWALASLIGPAVITGLTMLGTFFWTLVLPWLAMSAAIGSVLLVLEDIWSWAHGKRSIMGMLFGDYSLYQEQIEGIGKSLLHLFGLDNITRYGNTLQGILRSIRESLEGIQRDPSRQWWLMRDLERALTITKQILDAFNTVKSVLQTVDRYDPTQWAARHLYSFFSGSNTGGGTNIQMPVTVHANGATDPMAIGNATAHGVRNAMEGLFNSQPNRSKTAFPSLEVGGAR